MAAGHGLSHSERQYLEAPGGWVAISGQVRSAEGAPLCAMVLANGEHQFYCDGNGEYSLNAPLDGGGQISLMVFAEGYQSYSSTLQP